MKAPRSIQICCDKGNTRFAIVDDKDVEAAAKGVVPANTAKNNVWPSRNLSVGLIHGISLVIQMIVFQMIYCRVPNLLSFAPGCVTLFSRLIRKVASHILQGQSILCGLYTVLIMNNWFQIFALIFIYIVILLKSPSCSFKTCHLLY